jgi:hypothetical protein
MAFPFRSRTIGMLVRTIDVAYSNTGIGTLLLEAEADQWDPRIAPNKQGRLQALFSAMRDDGSDEATAAALEIARRLLSAGAHRARGPRPMIWWEDAVDTLAADGWEYDIDADRLVATVAGVSAAEETSRLEGDLVARGWETAAGHYRHALEAFGRGDWTSANGQLRNVVELVLPLAAEAASGKGPTQPRAAIAVLQARKVLVQGEFDVLKGLWDLLQPRGAHPGLSDKDEALFRLMTVTSEIRFLLTRLS